MPKDPRQHVVAETGLGIEPGRDGQVGCPRSAQQRGREGGRAHVDRHAVRSHSVLPGSKSIRRSRQHGGAAEIGLAAARRAECAAGSRSASTVRGPLEPQPGRAVVAAAGGGKLDVALADRRSTVGSTALGLDEDLVVADQRAKSGGTSTLIGPSTVALASQPATGPKFLGGEAGCLVGCGPAGRRRRQ